MSLELSSRVTSLVDRSTLLVDVGRRLTATSCPLLDGFLGATDDGVGGALTCQPVIGSSCGPGSNSHRGSRPAVRRAGDRHVNGWKAALSGAGSGLVLGLLFGLLFGIWFAHDGTSLLAILAYWAGLGALIGALVSLLGYALSGGRRNFASITGMQAQHFDVLVDEVFADDAIRRLAGTGTP